ncbi:MAG: phosphate-starvation-inducible PsiE family protein [Gammaproteobacteria bacterium]|nr:phosphate-starvation-inducible PsiE family protein [Gammaproteobacteria bacterium]
MAQHEQGKDELSTLKKRLETIGNIFVEAFHLLVLFVIGATVIWSAVAEYLAVIRVGHPTLKDILLLFIYLEIGAMVGIYFKTRRLPVVFLIYISITALTRVLTVDVKTMDWPHILVISGAILILALSVTFVSNKNPLFNISKRQQEAPPDSTEIL